MNPKLFPLGVLLLATVAAASSGCGDETMSVVTTSNDVEPSADERVPFTPENDQELIDGMVPHHRAAIMMADHVIAAGKREDVAAMAEMMRQMQAEEIETMLAAREQLAGSREVPEMNDPHMEHDLDQLMAASGTALDRLFLEHMLEHHAGALVMAHRALGNLERADMRQLAEMIIEDQSKEIGEIRAMLQE
jgi:uncharacterized protein (DUF305 family)